MTDDDLIELLVKYATEALDYDNAFPDDGMCMGFGEATARAEKRVLQEAARWNAVAALQIQFTPTIQKAVYDQLLQRRRR